MKKVTRTSEFNKTTTNDLIRGKRENLEIRMMLLLEMVKFLIQTRSNTRLLNKYKFSIKKVVAFQEF